MKGAETPLKLDVELGVIGFLHQSSTIELGKCGVSSETFRTKSQSISEGLERKLGEYGLDPTPFMG
jgi:hypothetical protein